MSGRQKVLLVAVAVLLVALYVVAVAGRRDDPGDPGAGPGAMARLGRGTGTVDPATVAVTCLPPAAEPATTADGVTLAFGTACGCGWPTRARCARWCCAVRRRSR